MSGEAAEEFVCGGGGDAVALFVAGAGYSSESFAAVWVAEL